MTTDELARDYFRRARVRRQVLDLLMNAGEHADVVREAQELVELALKGMLRWAGIDPPRWHDVGAILLEHQARLPTAMHPMLPAIVKASARLRREREAAFYGEIDMVPGQCYDESGAQWAVADADQVLAVLQYFD
ncbi:MAG: HEPN domain-containing protein [Rhodocyclaceae bacterium]|nr:HEPN domain-containing protein [Rhodocyclaceae bacterium]